MVIVLVVVTSIRRSFVRGGRNDGRWPKRADAAAARATPAVSQSVSRM